MTIKNRERKGIGREIEQWKRGEEGTKNGERNITRGMRQTKGNINKKGRLSEREREGTEETERLEKKRNREELKKTKENKQGE